ncbi:MAG: hypothetical protein IJ524_04425 [Bacteroidales bacterium]|nr:hypothetical protein [Bacteroidales bacterium]
MNTEKKEYTAPELTVVSFKSERGYASSITPLGALLFWASSDASQMEDYNTHDDWTESGGFWG